MRQSVTLRHAFIYLQGLQRENVWRFGKGLKGREILRFAQYDIKTQGAIHIYGVPLPETNPIYRSAFCYIIKFFHDRAEIARLVG